MDAVTLNMPFDFGNLVDQIIPLLANVIGGIAPFALIYVLGLAGIRYLSDSFKGKDAASPTGATAKPWDGHSEAMYEWYKDSIVRKDEEGKDGQEYFDTHAPEWAKARMEYEKTYDQIAERERRKQIHKMVEADIKSDIEAGKDIFGQRKFTPGSVRATETEEWFGDEEEEEDEFADLPY